MARKPRPQQFIGLMGRRSTGECAGAQPAPSAGAGYRQSSEGFSSSPAANAQISHKRKFSSFIPPQPKRSN